MAMGIGLGAMESGMWAVEPPTESKTLPTLSTNDEKTASDGWLRTDVPDEQIPESSGLTRSSVPGVFWTHNDSGGQSRLFAVSPDRGTLGHVNLVGVSAIDWEDIGSYVSDGHRWIIAADCGDNQSTRSVITLYRFREPAELAAWDRTNSLDSTPSIEIPADQIDRIEVTYVDGARDCEAMAIDVTRRKIVLIAKSYLPIVGVYEVDLSPEPHLSPEPFRPEKQRPEAQQPEKPQPGGSTPVTLRHRAERVATLPIPLVTAADWDPTTDQLVMTTYFQAFFFRAGDTPQSRWAQVPEVVRLPALKQVEGCALTSDGSLWITSEGVPMPIAQLPPSHFPQESKAPHE